MAGERQTGKRLPDFGRVLPRDGLVRGALNSPGLTVLIAAPGGYGKSVLASLIAQQGDFEAAAWIDCSGLDPGPAHVFRAVSHLFGDERRDNEHHITPLLPVSDPSGSRLEMCERLARAPQVSTCLILDNVPEDVPFRQVSEIATELATARAGSKVVVTTRCEDELALSETGADCVISVDNLRLSADEVASLLDMYAGCTWNRALLEPIIGMTGGQAALTSLLARHVSAGTVTELLEGSASLDVRSQLLSASASLTDESNRILYVASVLGSGTASDIREVIGSYDTEILKTIARQIPLFRVGSGGSAMCFAVHDLATAVFADTRIMARRIDGVECLLEASLRLLDYRGHHERLFLLLLEHSNDEALADWTERCGQRLLDKGAVGLLNQSLAALGSTSGLTRPRLLLLQAGLLRETADYTEALGKAVVARELAYFDGANEVHDEAMLVVARLQIDMGLLLDAARSLEEALGQELCTVSIDRRALAMAYLSACYAYSGRQADALSVGDEALRLVSEVESPDVAARVLLCVEGTTGVMMGRWDKALDVCAQLLDRGGLSLGLRMQVTGNYGTALYEVGRLDRARHVLDTMLQDCRKHGLNTLEYLFMSSLAATLGGLGEYRAAGQLMEAALERCIELGDRLELTQGLLDYAQWVRAAGDAEHSLSLSERALESAGSTGCEWLKWSAVLSNAASCLALGDQAAARRQVERVRTQTRDAGSQMRLLCADMLLAEIARREGRCHEAVSRVLEHEEYVLSESANWQLGMYIRAFPHLLGMLATAIGPGAVPIRLLRMTLSSDPDATLSAAREIMEIDQWHALASRIVGDEQLARFAPAPNPQCTVRFFGGLDVRVGDRVVGERDWKKRKARLLFAMLVLQQGREMPRDQVYEHLWPDMDEERARNNLYVIWSSMKMALTPEAGKETPCPYVENVRGVCRAVQDLVHSDVEEFEAELKTLREQDAADDADGALAAAGRLIDIYRGELLPGDVYDDWFTAARDRYRMEFGDAMLKGAELNEARSDFAGALRLTRAGLAADPWREDLYQAALRYQMASGQRSAAIETYMACKSRLGEDLGIDPSSDTLRLYEQILAMEDPADFTE